MLNFLPVFSDKNEPVFPVMSKITEVTVKNLIDARLAFNHIHWLDGLVLLSSNGKFEIVKSLMEAEHFYFENPEYLTYKE